jgi:hypothetical protein
LQEERQQEASNKKQQPTFPVRPLSALGQAVANETLLTSSSTRTAFLPQKIAMLVRCS